MIQLKNILIPTDFSAHSAKAADYGFALAEKFGAKVHVLHVQETLPSQTPMFVMGLAIPSHSLESKESALAAISSFLKAGGRSADGVVCAAIDGVPFVEVIRYAKEHEIDLIVIGTHGRTGLTHVLMGSVAERVVRKSACPVLTVRPEGHQFVMP